MLIGMTFMADPPLVPGEVTAWLRDAFAGDAQASERAYEALYAPLQAQARRLLRIAAGQHTLDVEGLVHEAYLKLNSHAKGDWESRGHFLAVMSRAMRQVLLDYERRRGAAKRGGNLQRVPLTGAYLPFDSRQVELLDLDAALERLRAVDEASARVVELRYFCGLSVAEAADELRTSKRTAERDLEYARRWLSAELDR